MTKSKITFKEYEEAAGATDNPKKKTEPYFAFIGLVGEIGDLLSIIKKDIRGDIEDTEHSRSVCIELGDSLWYLAKICRDHKIKLHELINCKDDDFVDDVYDKITLEFMSRHKFSFKISIILGKLASAVQDQNIKEIKNSLNVVLNLLLSLGYRFGLNMGEVVKYNIDKIDSLFLTVDAPLEKDFFDAEFPIFERFPRELEIEIKEETINGEKKVVLCMGDRIYGDPLDDNISGEADDYRYHDIFHLAFAAHLGWSPNLRALFNLKRKSKKNTDRDEDGARARFVEEGIVHLVFRYGQKNNFFKNQENVRVSTSLLSMIKSMTEGFEVDECPLSLWNEAIQDSFKIFIDVKKHRYGKISINMNERTIEFKRM